MQEHSPTPESEAETGRGRLRRRGALSFLGGGLVAGYGALAAIAGRYLYPARPDEEGWVFVTKLASFTVGSSLVYQTPAGETVNITRKGPGDDELVAMSSVCPHLGCQVHWEANNQRYFCPCHNGVFDAEGVGVSGPPGEAGQSLSRYALRVDNGLVYIKVRLEKLVDARCGEGQILSDLPETRPGHDPCLAQLPRTRRGARGGLT